MKHPKLSRHLLVSPFRFRYESASRRARGVLRCLVSRLNYSARRDAVTDSCQGVSIQFRQNREAPLDLFIISAGGGGGLSIACAVSSESLHMTSKSKEPLLCAHWRSGTEIGLARFAFVRRGFGCLETDGRLGVLDSAREHPPALTICGWVTSGWKAITQTIWAEVVMSETRDRARHGVVVVAKRVSKLLMSMYYGGSG